jgi:hypothetical protein
MGPRSLIIEVELPGTEQPVEQIIQRGFEGTLAGSGRLRTLRAQPLLPDTEAAEYLAQQILARKLTRDLAQRPLREP